MKAPGLRAIRTGLGLVAIAHRRCASRAALPAAEEGIEPDAVRAGDVCWLCGKPLVRKPRLVNGEPRRVVSEVVEPERVGELS